LFTTNPLKLKSVFICAILSKAKSRRAGTVSKNNISEFSVSSVAKNVLKIVLLNFGFSLKFLKLRMSVAPALKPLVCDQAVGGLACKVFAGHSWKWPVVEGSGFGGCSHPAEPNQDYPSQPTNQRNQRNQRQICGCF